MTVDTPAWTVLAYAFLGVFALLLVMENHKLRQLTARDRQAGALIEELTSLSTEGARLSRQREGDKQRRDYEALSIEWGQKVRTKLDGRGREFLADWEAADIEDRYELLRNIIRELRGRL